MDLARSLRPTMATRPASSLFHRRSATHSTGCVWWSCAENLERQELSLYAPRLHRFRVQVRRCAAFEGGTGCVPPSSLRTSQKRPRRPIITVRPESNSLYVALLNWKNVRRLASVMLITSTVSCGTKPDHPNKSAKLKLDEKSHCV